MIRFTRLAERQQADAFGFTYVSKLDKKKRLVLPLLMRERLGITDKITLTLEGNRIIVTRAGKEAGRKVSKNCEEVERKLCIGVLGGMGPEASARFYLDFIDLCRQRFGAEMSEFPPLLIFNLPTKDVIADRENEPMFLKQLAFGVVSLERGGADFIVIPCNTASTYISRIRASVPIASIVDETARAVKELDCVGLMATPTTVQSRAYAQACEREGVNLVLPNARQQKAVTEIIFRILAGEKREEDKKSLARIALSLKKNDAEAVILGCTDLPLLLRQEDTEVPLVDTIRVLAEAAVERSLNGLGGVAERIQDCGSCGPGSTPDPNPCKKKGDESD